MNHRNLGRRVLGRFSNDRAYVLRCALRWGLVGLAASVIPAMAQDGDGGIPPPPEVLELKRDRDPAIGDDGFPIVLDSPSVPDEAIDGPAFLIGVVTLEYMQEHPNLPTIEELERVRFELVQTPSGWVGPRPGLPTMTLSLADLRDGQVRNLHASAIRAIGRALVVEFRERSLAGVLVEPDSRQISARLRDLRDEGETGLTLLIYNVRATELHSIASGDRIRIEDRIDARQHRRIVERSPVRPYVEGETTERRDLVRRDLLDGYAMMLNRHPGRRVDVAIARGAEQGEVEVHYLVQEGKPWTVYAQLSNTGTSNTEEWRQRFGFIHNQLTGRDDILSIEYITAGFEASHAVVGSYEARFGGSDRLRWRVQGSYNEFTASDVGVLEEEFEGDGWTLGGDLIWNFYQHRNLFLDVVGGARWEHISIKNATLGTGNEGEDDLFIPRIGLQAQQITDTASFFGSLNYEWTMSGVSGAQTATLEQLGRLSPDKDWQVLQWDTSLSVFLEPLLNYSAWSDPSTPRSSTLAHEVFLSFRGQYAFGKRLIPNAEQVLGGLYTVRGYSESAVAGDTSWVGTLEYRFHVPRALKINPEPKPLFGSGRPFKVSPQSVYGRPDWDLVLKGFLDVGQVYNSDRRVFERDETLVGAGLGVELQLMSNLSFRTDWGVVLDEIGDGQEEVGDSRFHFVLTILF